MFSLLTCGLKYTPFLLPIFPPPSHPIVVFLSCRPFVVNATFSTGLVGFEVSSAYGLGHTRRQMKLQRLTRPLENVALTKKYPQDRNTTIEWDDGGKIGNKNELIPTETFPSVRETYLKELISKINT